VDADRCQEVRSGASGARAIAGSGEKGGADAVGAGGATVCLGIVSLL
jgi:hypothetical protein